MSYEEKEDIFKNFEFTFFCKILRSGKFLQVRLRCESRGGRTRRASPLKLEKIWFFWRKIVFLFHTKYPKNFRASLRSTQFFKVRPPPPTWNPGSAPETYNDYKMRKHWILIFDQIKVLRIVYKIPNFHSFEPTHKSAVCFQMSSKNVHRRIFMIPNNETVIVRRHIVR
jgi:hypothetical protein